MDAAQTRPFRFLASTARDVRRERGRSKRLAKEIEMAEAMGAPVEPKPESRGVWGELTRRVNLVTGAVTYEWVYTRL